MYSWIVTFKGNSEFLEEEVRYFAYVHSVKRYEVVERGYTSPTFVRYVTVRFYRESVLPVTPPREERVDYDQFALDKDLARKLFGPRDYDG
jgi:hypothetical protein